MIASVHACDNVYVRACACVEIIFKYTMNNVCRYRYLQSMRCVYPSLTLHVLANAIRSDTRCSPIQVVLHYQLEIEIAH